MAKRSYMPANNNKSNRTQRRKRRAVVAFNALLALILLLVVGGGGYFRWSAGRMDRVDLGNLLDPNSDKGVTNILLVGWDSRASLSASDQRKYGSAQETPGLADTIMLVRLDKSKKTASALSIPRDTYVPIYSGHGTVERRGKINSAFSGGGARGQASLTETVRKNFHVPVNHFVQVDFNGFKGIVSAIGGVDVPFDAPTRDLKSGLRVNKVGCVRLSGDDALAYVRSRSPETLNRGRWVTEGGKPDIERIARQQDFVKRVLASAMDKAQHNPLALKGLIDAGVRNVTLDSGFSVKELAQTAGTFRTISTEDLDMQTLPTQSSYVRVGKGGEWRELVEQNPMTESINRFLGATPDASTGSPASPATAPRPTPAGQARATTTTAPPAATCS